MENPTIQIKSKADNKVLLELGIKELMEGWWDAFEELDDHGFKDCDIQVVDKPK